MVVRPAPTRRPTTPARRSAPRRRARPVPSRRPAGASRTPARDRSATRAAGSARRRFGRAPDTWDYNPGLRIISICNVPEPVPKHPGGRAAGRGPPHRLPQASDSTRVLDGLTFQLRPGEIGCLLDASGCGKATALFTIAGFIRPDHGSVLIGERCVASPRQNGFVLRGGLPPRYRGLRGEPRRATR